jgi:hypothetical protein
MQSSWWGRGRSLAPASEVVTGQQAVYIRFPQALQQQRVGCMGVHGSYLVLLLLPGPDNVIYIPGELL